MVDLLNPKFWIEKLWYVLYSKALGEEHDKNAIITKIKTGNFFSIFYVTFKFPFKDSNLPANEIGNL